jgi:hypothetical protein
VTLWVREGGRWRAEREHELGARVSALAMHEGAVWAASGTRVVEVGGARSHELEAPVLDLRARAGRIFAWCPPHVVACDTLERVDTGVGHPTW